MAKEKVITISTIGGAIDELLTWMVLAQNSDLLAVACTAVGESRAAPSARNAASVLALLDKGDVPVGIGSEDSVSGIHRFPAGLLRLLAESMMFTPIKKVETIKFPDASNLLYEKIVQSPEKVRIIVTGPITDVADLLRIHPDIKHQIKEIVIMAGALNVAGNARDFGKIDGQELDPTLEWNALVDPMSLDFVLRSGVPVLLVPLDATNTANYTLALARKLSASPQNEPEALLARYMHHLSVFAFVAKLAGKPLPLWDPATALAALDPESLSVVQDVRVLVNTDSTNAQYGRTVVSQNGAEIRVLNQIDPTAFEQAMVKALRG